MIPQNQFTPTPIVDDYLYPNTLQYHELSQIVMGGTALNNPLQGRLYQPWECAYEDGVIHVRPLNGANAFSLTIPDVRTISLSFDSNMSVVLTWRYSTGAKLYYFDTLTSQYITRDFPGVTSCRVAVDEPAVYYVQDSDVIFAYTRAGNLYWRQQRDRYDIERLVGATDKYLVKVGMNKGYRLQFKLMSRV